jgi:non-lysosomal glucosylceramidase
LAAVYGMIQMLENSEYPEKVEKIAQYKEILTRGKKSFHDKLWTGEYYKFDCSNEAHGLSIMSDQICGHWFLAMCGVDDSEIFPKSNVLRSLKTIYEKNVMGVRNGEMGAVNGMNPNGSIDIFTVQSEEIWTGVSYSVGATMIHAVSTWLFNSCSRNHVFI